MEFSQKADKFKIVMNKIVLTLMINNQIIINLPLFSTVVPSNILDGTTVENKGKLILTEIFPSVQKHDI